VQSAYKAQKIMAARSAAIVFWAKVKVEKRRLYFRVLVLELQEQEQVSQAELAAVVALEALAAVVLQESPR
jgi:hypothetical protein